MVPEAPMEDGPGGKKPAGEGWFVLNVREAAWIHNEKFGAGATFEGDPRQFSFAVSEIVRQYVEEAFRVRAAHRTTEELLADLMLDRSPVALHRTALGEFLRYCDLAKFAGWSLSPADRSALLTSAETFVRATSVPTTAEQVRRAAIRGEGMA